MHKPRVYFGIIYTGSYESCVTILKPLGRVEILGTISTFKLENCNGGTLEVIKQKNTQDMVY